MAGGIGPTTRVAAACVFILAEVLLYPGHVEWWIGWLLLLAAMAAAWGAGAGAVLRRAVPALPFLVLVAVFLPFSRPGPTWWRVTLGSWEFVITEPGLMACGMVLAKSSLAVLAMSAVAATTTAPEICRALQDLGVPGLLVLTISLALRYLVLMREEIGALLQARELRRFGRRRVGSWSEPGHLVGTLFARSIERAERVHGAMLLRGFTGEFRVLAAHPTGPTDRVFLFGVLAASVLLGVLARW